MLQATLHNTVTESQSRWRLARVNWKRGQYSDVFRSSIIDPSPLKRGQKVQVLWGTKTKKELTAVVSVYPVVEKEAAITEDVLPSRRTKAKRKLVSYLFVVCMKRHSIYMYDRFREVLTALHKLTIATWLQLQIPESPPAKIAKKTATKVSKETCKEKKKEKPKGKVSTCYYIHRKQTNHKNYIGKV